MGNDYKITFDKPRCIITEGVEDVQFVRALCDNRGFEGFNIHTTRDLDTSGGNSAFGKAIASCEPLTGFDKVDDVVIITDSDDDPQASFDFVCAQIEKERGKGNLDRNWGAPTAPGTKALGDPALTIRLLPDNSSSGCLETILWSAIEDAYPDIAICVEAACACSEAEKWSKSKLDKARIRCFISIANEKNPGISLFKLWQMYPDLIPLDHEAFNPFSDFLASI